MSQDLPVTAYAILGLLTFGDELTGYEIKQRADMTLQFSVQVRNKLVQAYQDIMRMPV